MKQQFIDKWSIWFILEDYGKKLKLAFERELDDVIGEACGDLKEALYSSQKRYFDLLARTTEAENRVAKLEELLISIAGNIERAEKIGNINLLTTNSVEYDSIKRLINKGK